MSEPSRHDRILACSWFAERAFGLSALIDEPNDFVCAQWWQCCRPFYWTSISSAARSTTVVHAPWTLTPKSLAFGCSIQLISCAIWLKGYSLISPSAWGCMQSPWCNHYDHTFALGWFPTFTTLWEPTMWFSSLLSCSAMGNPMHLWPPLKDKFWIWQNYFCLQIKLICILYK